MENWTKMSAEICANGQKSRKVACAALLPKVADVNIWTNKLWHLNRMVTYFEKIVSIGENADSNIRKEEYQKRAHGVWPQNWKHVPNGRRKFLNEVRVSVLWEKLKIECESFSAKNEIQGINCADAGNANGPAGL